MSGGGRVEGRGVEGPRRSGGVNLNHATSIKFMPFSGLAPSKLKIFPKNFKGRLCVHRGIDMGCGFWVEKVKRVKRPEYLTAIPFPCVLYPFTVFYSMAGLVVFVFAGK